MMLLCSVLGPCKFWQRTQWAEVKNIVGKITDIYNLILQSPTVI